MLETSYVFRDLIPSLDNGNPKPHRSRFRDQGLGIPLSKVGFPIRKSADQSFFAAPHGLSQRSTSFIASQRQGIRQTPLFHLIALIINAHPTRRGSERTFGFVLNGTLIQKDQLASRSFRRWCGQAPPTLLRVRGRYLARRRSVTISSSRCQTTRTPRRSTTRANEFSRTNNPAE